MTAQRVPIKAGKASLIGGIFVGIACFLLWAGIARQSGADTLPWLAIGAVVSACVATWIRMADL